MKSFTAVGLGLLTLGLVAPGLRADSGEEVAKAVVPAAVATDYASAVKVTRLLKSTTDAAGRPLAYPKPEDGQAEVTALHVEIAAGGQTGWHKHPLTCLGYVLEGEIEVTMAGGHVHTVKAGEALCEVVDLPHNGVNRGAVPAKLVLFVLGTKDGGPFTVKVPAPEGGAGATDGKKPGE
jgi:quercetin dioxygenase-like cupin family protein